MWEKRSSVERASERLAARRRSKRRRARIVLGVLILFICGGAIYGLQQSAVRISHIQVFGADPSFAGIAQAVMRGSYLGLIPRDSTFFFPASRIRSDIITAYPSVAAVSLFRDGLMGLSIKVDNRFPVARWCGANTPPQAAISTPSEGCYVFDASGFIYATTSVDTMDSPQAAQPINSFIVYAPLSESSAPESPIGTTLSNARKLPTTFDFARQLTALGSPVITLIIRGDEVDDYLASGTRVTYVLGDEQNAFTALTSARANLDLADGSIDYIDLRFGGKIYLKRK